MSNHLMTDFTVGGNTDAEIRAAVAACVHHSTDDAEAREFCQALGLLPTRRERPEPQDATGRMRSGTYRKEQA